MMKHLRIHREGRNMLLFILFIIVALCVSLLFMPDNKIVTIILIGVVAVLLCFVVYFFRNPVREIIIDDNNFIIAPADGRVVAVEPVMENDYFHEQRMQVSIFMSPFNVHANWYPIEGDVLLSEHQKGRHKGAWLPKSSTENERSAVIIKAHNGKTILVRQIAGALARRIVTYAKAGDKAHINQHLGFIKLGSRVDVYLPMDTEIYVVGGEPVVGNETIIGRLSADDQSEQENKN